MRIDFRSDTVTRPSKGMLEAMYQAKVGDDVFDEDPAIHELQDYTAGLFKMEAALFCPSGTMTNQIAIKVHTRPGDELICDASAHIYNYEGGGIAFNSGVQAKLLQGDLGRLKAVQLKQALNADFDWLARTSLVCLENTVNRSGGSIYALKDIEEIAVFCQAHQLKLHLDGARIFNALTETGESPSAYGNCFDSISICLSKGLGAPVGSLLLGNREFIKQARRIRKVFGGGMRQAGVLAAAGLYALKNNVERLRQDHEHAAILAAVLREKPVVKDMLPVKTNIVIFTLQDDVDAAGWVRSLQQKDIIVSAFGGQTIRMVTHLDISPEMMERAIAAIKAL